MLSTVVHAPINDACTTGSTPGVCLATASCTSVDGTTHTGYCPNDLTDVKCCTKTCRTGRNYWFTSTCTIENTHRYLFLTWFHRPKIWLNLMRLCPADPSDFRIYRATSQNQVVQYPPLSTRLSSALSRVPNVLSPVLPWSHRYQP